MSTSNQYFFILGNNPALSVAEILAWLERKNIKYSDLMSAKEFLVLTLDQKLSATSNNELGGVIKFGEVIDEFSNSVEINTDWLVDKILDFTNAKAKTEQSNKFYFGFSVYPPDKEISYKLRGMGLETKKHLKEYKITSRLVMSKQDNLSSVVVQKNKLVTESGWEIVILNNNNKFLIGRTLGVQPFEALGKRDFGRPDRDDFSGMLPPKLAQAMLNLASQPEEAILVDAFCGSGTIVQEALLLGYKNLSGFDASRRAVEDSRENIRWLAEEFTLDISKIVIKNIDVKELDKNLKNNSVDAIVSEPFLGPPARGKRQRKEIDKITNELVDLYKKAFINFSNILKTNGRVVFIFPVFVEHHQSVFMPLEKIIPMDKFQKITPIPKNLQSIYYLSNRGGLMYGRQHQKVQREIMVFSKR